MKFSLLVVTTDRLLPTERLFRSLAAQSHKDFEVLFVHGQACAAEAPALAGKYADVLSIRAVPSPTPALSRARNLALSLLTGDCVAFPDDDCVYAPDTLEKVCVLFRAHPEADVLLAAGKDLREADPKDHLETSSIEKMPVKGRPVQAQGRTLSGREPVPNPAGGSGLRPVNRFTAFRRSETFLQFYRGRCVEVIGPFDETLGPGTDLPYGCGEDTDYVLRALGAGFGVYRAPSVVVLHPAALASGPPPARKVRAYAAGRMRLLRKHGLPLWFVPANILWPLLCVPGECLRECRDVVRFRWDMFRARLASCMTRSAEQPGNGHVPGAPCLPGGSGTMRSPFSSMERIVRKLLNEYVSERDRTLIDCVFAPAPAQEALDACLRVCDIEAMGAHQSLMLSYLMHEHPELQFSDYAAPRLQGLIRFYRFANVETLARFASIGKALNAADIPLLLFKGAAMKALRPGLARPMGDVDILVRPEHMAATIKICEKHGLHDALTGSAHAVDMHTADGKSAVDVHSAVLESPKDTGAFHTKLFSRARPVTAFGVKVLLPAHEDLYFLVLANLTKNLREKTSIHGLFYALFDCRFLPGDKPGFDWSIVRDDAREAGMELEVRLAAEFMNALVPGIVPDAERHFLLTAKLEDYCNRLIFEDEYLRERREACRAIRVVDLKNYPAHYGAMIVKLLLLKKLRSFPAFVRWYLETRGRKVCDAH